MFQPPRGGSSTSERNTFPTLMSMKKSYVKTYAFEHLIYSNATSAKGTGFLGKREW